MALAIAAACFATVALAGCDNNKSSIKDVDYKDLPAYTATNYEGKESDKVQFSTDLFYRNDIKVYGADPYVYDNTERDGYFYLFVTSGLCNCYRSADLVNWEPLGNALDTVDYGKEEELRVTWNAVWAEEIIYDEDEEKYHMFFSVSPDDNQGAYILVSATSENPYGPYTLVNYEKAETCGGAQNLRDNTSEKFNDFYTKYCLLNPAEYEKFSKILNVSGTSNNGYYAAIDPHPYVAADGTKYLYFVNSLSCNSITVIQMLNWYTPMWNTVKPLTVAHYYTVQDFEDSRKGIYVEPVTYEMGSTYINEGPTITEHNGMFYLTFSINGYGDSTYQVIQAVSENPDGPFRKLTEGEGGQLLCVQNIDSNEKLSGTGHHSFIERDGKQYIIYHRHNDYVSGGSSRNPAIDEVKWMTVKDKDGNPLDVMYVNGPTWSVQPLPEINTSRNSVEYTNVATEASVKLVQGALASDSSAYFLNDDILSVQSDTDFANEYISETKITKTSEFEFKFAKPKDVRAVMVYNAADYREVFLNVSKIELDCAINGANETREIRNVAFPKEYYSANSYDGALRGVSAGAAAFAEFDNVTVTAVRVRVEVPEGQEQVGLSEVKILGKEGTSTSSVKDVYTPVFNYDRGERIKDAEITVDGKLDEQIWKDQKAAGKTVTERGTFGNVYQDLTMYSHFGDNGIMLAFEVFGNAQIWHNPNRASYINSSIELYLWHQNYYDGVPNYYNHGFEMDLELDGDVASKRHMSGGGVTWWNGFEAPYAIFPYCAATVYTKDESGNITVSEYNDEKSNGFVIEYFIPWEYLEYTGFKQKDETITSVRVCPTLIISMNFNGTHHETDRKWAPLAGWHEGADPVNWICSADGVRRP